MNLFVVDEGSGPAILLVHGIAGAGSDWNRVASALASDHRRIIPDRPGYGRSAGHPVSMTRTADYLADTLRYRSAVPTVVVGHSYGGGVAVLLAARHPSLVSGLVLAAPVGRADGRTPWHLHALALPIVGEGANALRLFATRLLHPRERRDRSIRRPGLWRTTASERRFLLREIDLLESSLPDLTIPTVVVTGALDDVVPPSVAVRTAAEVPEAELVIVPGTGHVLPRDAPDVIASAVRSVELRARATGRWDRHGPDMR